MNKTIEVEKTPRCPFYYYSRNQNECCNAKHILKILPSSCDFNNFPDNCPLLESEVTVKIKRPEYPK